MQFKGLNDMSEIIYNITEMIVYNGHPIPPAYTERNKGDRPYSRFFYVVKGTIIFDAGTDKQLEATAGDIVYLPGGVAYKSYWKKENNCEYISANCMLLDREENQVFFADEIVILANNTEKEFLTLFRSIHRIFYARPANWQFLLKSSFYTLLAKIINETLQDQIPKHTTAQVAGEGIAWLEFEYMKNTTLDDLAKKCGVSKSCFGRNCNTLTGMSPIAYRNNIRFERAYDFLKTGIYSVKEVALMVGFNDIPYFSKAFKKKFGISPSECIALGGKKKNKD